jgi:hypothetical protein
MPLVAEVGNTGLVSVAAAVRTSPVWPAGVRSARGKSGSGGGFLAGADFLNMAQPDPSRHKAVITM